MTIEVKRLLKISLVGALVALLVAAFVPFAGLSANAEEPGEAAPSVPVHAVILDPNGGDPLPEGQNVMYVLHKEKMDDPPVVPTRVGHSFDGWATEPSSRKAFKSSKKITEDMVLYAIWEPDEYKVSFDTNGGKSLSSKKRTKTVGYGSAIGEMPNPERKGSEFLGWFTTPADVGGAIGVQVAPSEPIFGHVTYYARWRMDNETYTWQFLRDRGLSKDATAGVMGNLRAESAMRPNNLENKFNAALGMTDEEYTFFVDAGVYGNFAGDSAGYGLAQWTYSTRKAALYNHARARGTSISDIDMQLDFLWLELRSSYPGTLDALRNAKSASDAAEIFMLQYERPANQSESAIGTRAGYAKDFLKQFK